MKNVRNLLLICVLAVPATAQTTLFADDFTDGTARWSLDAPWHWAQANNACVLQSNADPAFGAMVRMGDPDCTFNSISVGLFSMTMLDPVAIPINAVAPSLQFDSLSQSEGCFHWDFHDLLVSTDAGAAWQYLNSDCSHGWRSNSISLSSYVGQSILIRFRFNPVDGAENDGLGWLIDNVKIVMAGCSSHNYCVGAPNSASPSGAQIGFIGSSQVNQNNFSLTLDDGPPGQFAFFYYGPDTMQYPIASGFLCVAGDQFGIRRLFPGGQIDANGQLGKSVDFTTLVGYRFIDPGTTHNFQCWYRDQVGGMNTSNFSDALSVTFCE